MTEVEAAFLIWLPTATIVPFLISRLTGSDWGGALIEASIFAGLSLIIYPTLLAFLVVRFVDELSIPPLFLGGYLLSFLTLLLFRRRAGGPRHWER